MQRCDVLIVGGGPGGSSCAWGLRDSGLDVLVVDAKPFPRDKICAGWITPQVLRELSIDPEQYRKQRVLQPIHGFRLRRIGDAESHVHSATPISYGIRRCELDHFLLERCEARLRLGEPIRQIERAGDRWRLNGSIEARWLVGAGGHFCPVARRLSEPGPEGEPIVAAQEVEFELDPADREHCPVRADTPELFFTPDLKGYGWIFRKGDWLNVGLGRQDKHRLGDRVAEFVEFLGAEGRLPRRMSRDFKGHAYLLYGQAPRRLVDDGVLLVGDAAGLAYPRSGEGIRAHAARSAHAARGTGRRRSRCPRRLPPRHRGALRSARPAPAARIDRPAAAAAGPAAGGLAARAALVRAPRRGGPLVRARARAAASAGPDLLTRPRA
jgi:flavin-dependent dehydrogenase